jgi:hypothetical protein
MSRGQGADFFKYHDGQHGGMTSDANIGGAPLSAISHSMLPKEMWLSARTNSTMGAIEAVSHLKDQAGGRHCKKHGKKHRKSHRKSHKCHKRHKRHSRKRGGNLDYAPFPNKGMLLDSQKEYNQAGLNPDWKTDPAFRAAYDRSQQ